MKKIMLLGCFMCNAVAWACTDYESCANKEREQFRECVRLNNWQENSNAIHGCAEAYKFGLAQCKEVYINKGK